MKTLTDEHKKNLEKDYASTITAEIEEVFDIIDCDGIERARAHSKEGYKYDRYAIQMNYDDVYGVSKILPRIRKAMESLKEAAEMIFSGMFHSIEEVPEVVLYWRLKPSVLIHKGIVTCHWRMYAKSKSNIPKGEPLVEKKYEYDNLGCLHERYYDVEKKEYLD